MHVCVLKILGLAIPMHLSTFHQDFLIFNRGHAPLKSVTYGHEHPASFVLSICLANKHWFHCSYHTNTGHQAN